jgi:hypothetical protein
VTAPPALFGIDKAEAPASAWLQALYDVSDLRFTGAYIDGPVLPGHRREEFTSPSMATNRHWMERVPAASQDGWGIVLFYLGYSSGADGSAHRSVHPPTGQPTPARGRLHAQHLKHVVATAIPGWAGAVVMIDNENSEAFSLDAPAEKALKDYYLALCAELEVPGPAGAPAMRPGFYLHAPVARPLLRVRPDLFLWDVQIDVADPGGSTTTTAPFDPAAVRIAVAPALSIRPAAVAPAATGPATGPSWLAWPVGRQFRFYTGMLPQRGSPVTRGVPALTPIATFDFDCALVRDPAFPVAEPRIAALSGGPDAAVVRGAFTEPVRHGAATSLPRMDLAILGDRGASTALASSPELPVEPDAPVVVVPPQMPDTMLSVSRNGVALERTLVSGGWTGWAAVGAPPPSLRRLRAIAGLKRSDGTTYAVTVSADHRLYAQRRPRGGVWSDPAAMAGDLRLHPFSTLTATLRGADQVEVVCIDAAGNLANAWWSTLMSTWPGEAHALVESSPGLLAGGSLAAAAPASDSLLAFGIGRDLRLMVAVFRSGRGWRAPQPLGQPQDRLTPHARIAAQTVSPDLVEVVGISHELRLVVHRLRLTAGVWTPEPAVVLPTIPPAGAAPPPARSAGGPAQPAVGWTLNPFADVALGRTAAGRSYVAASALAATATRTAAVACFLDGQQGWWRFG